MRRYYVRNQFQNFNRRIGNLTIREEKNVGDLEQLYTKAVQNRIGKIDYYYDDDNVDKISLLSHIFNTMRKQTDLINIIMIIIIHK